MPVMNMPRDFVVSTTSGHTVVFKDGENVVVPDVLAVIELCLKYGAKFVDKIEEAKVLTPDVGNKPKRKAPGERRKMINELFRTMIDNQSDHRTHFTSAGEPSPEYVRDALGFDVHATEIESMWKVLLQKK